jgi:hypothetical protein
MEMKKKQLKKQQYEAVSKRHSTCEGLSMACVGDQGSM